MGTPDTSLATLRPDLDGSFMEFDLETNQMGFISTQVFPVLNPRSQAGSFGKIKIEELLKERDTTRAPGTGYSRSTHQFTKETYATEEQGAEEPVDDREETMYASYFDAEVIAASRARNAVRINAEKRLAAAVFNETTFTSFKTAVGNEWDDAENATPIVDVEAAVQSVWDQTGIWPDTMIMNRKVFRNLRNVDEIVSRVKFQGFMDVRAGNIPIAALSQVFDIPKLIVANSARDSAKEGQTTVIAPIWLDEYCMICKTANTNDIKEPCLGRIFHWTADGSQIDGRMETYRDEVVRADIVRSRHDVDEKMLYVEMGHLLTNITS